MRAVAVAGDPPSSTLTFELHQARPATGLPSDMSLSDAPVVVMRADGTILYASDGYLRLVGRTRDELVGVRAADADIASSAARTRWIFERAAVVGSAFSYRRLYSTAEGDRLVDVSVHRAAEELVVTTMADVTECEDDRHTTGVPGSFLNAVPLGVVIYDRNLRIVRVNRTFEEPGRPEHLGRPLQDVLPDVDALVVRAIGDVLESGERIVNLAVTRDDGHSLLLNFFPIRDGHDEVVEVGCLFTDVTEFVTAHETIRVQQEAIRELATPILELADGVLVAPLVGAMDAARARDLTERLMAAITKVRAEFVIFDVTGVPVIDSTVAHELLNAVAVARLMGGVRAAMSGISPEHAEAITRVGVKTSGLDAVATLADAVAIARSGVASVPR